MLQFEKIEINDTNIESIGDVEGPIPKSFDLIFSDDELLKEQVPELEKRLDGYDFALKNELILFSINYDELRGYLQNNNGCILFLS